MSKYERQLLIEKNGIDGLGFWISTLRETDDFPIDSRLHQIIKPEFLRVLK